MRGTRPFSKAGASCCDEGRTSTRSGRLVLFLRRFPEFGRRLSLRRARMAIHCPGRISFESLDPADP
ncbi:MAG: hypothetical protein OXG81_12075 [Acidobacteria bacterium]|nr:hypothetical protein [Acidobacteriota bacterium]